MRPGYTTPLVIAIMAFAVVAFLFLIDTAINPDGSKKTTNTTNTTSVNTSTANVNAVPSNTNSTVNTNTTVDPTTGWKTYTNTQLKYSIKYPSDWSIGLETDKQTTISGADTGTPFTAPSVSITTSEPDQPSSCLLKEEMVTVLGESRLRQTQGCGYAGSSIATFIKKENIYYSISWSEDVAAEYPTYELILSTFTFTNPTAGWKTYTAPTAKYSFMYPDGLGNAEIQGMMYLGGLDSEKAGVWEANLAVIDTDKESQILYIYTPLQSDEPGTTLTNMIPGSWKNSALYTKSTRTINEITFDKYIAIGAPDNNVREGYAVTRAGRHYILSLMDSKIELARNIVSTFTITD